MEDADNIKPFVDVKTKANESLQNRKDLIKGFITKGTKDMARKRNVWKKGTVEYNKFDFAIEKFIELQNLLEELELI